MDYVVNAKFEFFSSYPWFSCVSSVPKKGQVLDCFYERNNVFDIFAIKVCEKESNRTVGHLHKEITRATKFILDRGAIVVAEVSTDHYRRSPLVQGGIPCKITVRTPVSFNMRVLKNYEDLVTALH